MIHARTITTGDGRHAARVAAVAAVLHAVANNHRAERARAATLARVYHLHYPPSGHAPCFCGTSTPAVKSACINPGSDHLTGANHKDDQP